MMQYEHLLKEFLAFQSISADTTKQVDLQECANWIAELLAAGGMQSEVWPVKDSNPVVFANYHVTDAADTVLIYGHYDVQPASRTDGWKTEPFQLETDGDKYYGRGVIDNKGQILIHIVTALELIKAGKLKVNLKFLIEGNEETGSKSLPLVIEANKQALKCDRIIISDGDIIKDNPVIEAGFRGVANATLVYKTALTNVHSGGYGNTIPNAAHEISKLVTKLFNDDEDIVIPGFYDDVPKTILEELPISLESFNKSIGVKKLFVKDSETWHNKVGNLPALVVTGMQSGYIGTGFANIVPNTAELRFNIRFGQEQSPEKVLQALEDFIKKATPEFVDYTLTFTSFVKAERLNLETDYIKKLRSALAIIYGNKTLVKYVGGTLPIIGAFREHLGVEPISIPLANEDSNMHGVGENFAKEKIALGLKFSSWLLS